MTGVVRGAGGSVDLGAGIRTADRIRHTAAARFLVETGVAAAEISTGAVRQAVGLVGGGAGIGTADRVGHALAFVVVIARITFAAVPPGAVILAAALVQGLAGVGIAGTFYLRDTDQSLLVIPRRAALAAYRSRRVDRVDSPAPTPHPPPLPPINGPAAESDWPCRPKEAVMGRLAQHEDRLPMLSLRPTQNRAVYLTIMTDA